MVVDKEVRKIELYRILKNLYFLTQKGDINKYAELKKDFQKLAAIVFGNNYFKNKDYDIWDLARNQLDNIFTSKLNYENGRMSKEAYEDFKKQFQKKFLELMEKIENENKL